MPAAPTYASRIPEALDSLRGRADGLVTRRQVEELLGVKKRTANDIIGAAGAVAVGNSRCVMRDELIRYLEHFGYGADIERERQKTFARKLTHIRQEFIETPRCLVDTATVEPRGLARANRLGLAGLPEGVTIEPGRITIANFCNGVEALERLTLLAMALGVSSFEEFDERVRVVKEGERKAS
jgi:hypothetical protein